MESKDCPNDHLNCQHQSPVWQTRLSIIPQTVGFLVTCDMRLLPMEEFLHVVKSMHRAAVDYLKDEGIIIETRVPGLRLVKS